MPRNYFLCIFLFLVFQLSFGQEADSLIVKKHPALTDRYIFAAGMYLTSKDVVMNVDGNLPNKPINFGKTLGLARHENTFALNFNWRFSKSKKWYLGVEYFSVNNSNEIVLEDEIKWEDTYYPVGVVLESGFGIDLYRLFFGRVISMGEKHELAGGLGIHAMNVHTFIEPKAYLGSQFYVLDTKRRNIDVIAPVPNIGFRYLFAPNLRWLLSMRADWFAIQIGDYKGSLWNLAPSISFQVMNNIGIGVGYKYFNAELNMKRQVWRGGVDLIYQGPLFSISGNF